MWPEYGGAREGGRGGGPGVGKLRVPLVARWAD